MGSASHAIISKTSDYLITNWLQAEEQLDKYQWHLIPASVLHRKTGQSYE